MAARVPAATIAARDVLVKVAVAAGCVVGDRAVVARCAASAPTRR